MSSVPLMALRNSERRSDEAHDSDQISDEEDEPLESVLANMKYRYGNRNLFYFISFPYISFRYIRWKWKTSHSIYIIRQLTRGITSVAKAEKYLSTTVISFLS